MSLKEFDLTGRVAVITGGGRGIGKGIALVLAEAGCDVVITGAGEANAKRVADEVKKLGRRGLGLAADATKLADTQRAADRVLADFGKVDILVNCVGDSIPGTVAPLPDTTGQPSRAMSEADWHTIVDINLTQAFTGCRAFGPHMLARKSGCVVNISSFAALRGRPNMVAYAAAKAGLTKLTEALALEWAPYNVRVNAIAPGRFPDPDQMSADDWRRREEEAAKAIPLRRNGKLREVGLMTAYFASDAAAYVTGQTVAIDGGMTL